MQNFLNRKLSRNYQIKTDCFSSHQIITNIISKLYKKGDYIVDLGCDVGFLGYLLHKKQIPKKNLCAVDLSFQNLKQAANFYSKTVYLDLNKNFWPIRRKFDMIVIADTLEHLVNPEKIIQKTINLLKPQGVIIISIPNSVYWWARLIILSGNFPKHHKGIFDKTHLHFYSLDSFKKFLNQFKQLKLLNYYPTQAPLFLIFKSKWELSIIRIIYHLTYFLVKFWPSLFAYQHIFVVKKKSIFL